MLSGSFVISLYVAFVCVFEVLSVTRQCCDNRENRFAMSREGSQVDFAKENVILNVSLRPPPPSTCTLHFNSIINLKCVN